MSEYYEKLLTEAKTWIGKGTKLVRGRCPVQREPVKRRCHTSDDYRKGGPT